MNQETAAVEFFGPLLTDPSKIKREAVRRRKQFDEKSITAEEITEYEADDWQVDRRLKRSIRVKRPKAIDRGGLVCLNRFGCFLGGDSVLG